MKTRSVEDLFNRAYEYAIMFSEEDKKVGLAVVDQRGNIHYEANVNGENPVVRFIKRTRHRKQNKIMYDKCDLYITDDTIPSEEVNEIIRKFGFRSYSVLSSDIEHDRVSNNTTPGYIYNKYKRSDYINDADYEDWWTNVLYEKAYDIVKDRKFPVTIPGYNRPELPTLRNLKVFEYTEDLNWPFFIIVRESQYDMYVEATKDYKYVTIKSFPDEIINNAGAVRRTTQKWLHSQGIRATFQMDDDVNYLGYSYAGRKGDGYPKSQYRKPKTEPFSSARVLAMWQLAMEKAMDEYNIVISCGQQIAFSWKEDYCRSEGSCRLMRGPMTQVVCFNVEKLCEEGLYHNNNADVGFDDIDFTLRVIESGNVTCCFPWLVYGCEALGGGNGDKVSEDRLKSRFKANQDKLKSIHFEKPYVSFRPKRDLDQVCINWRRARRFFVDNFGFDESLVNDSEYNIWNLGELIK